MAAMPAHCGMRVSCMLHVAFSFFPFLFFLFSSSGSGGSGVELRLGWSGVDCRNSNLENELYWLDGQNSAGSDGS